MMKLVKLENNQFICSDNYWHPRTLCTKLIFLLVILFLTTNTYAQAQEQTNVNVQDALGATTTSTSTSTRPTTPRVGQLNDEHANMFAEWLGHISTFLYDLSLNYSGFKTLNRTYYNSLLNEKNAKFAVINFTSMIINISDTISDVLNKKTMIVKDLSEMAERAYDQYEDQNDVYNLYKEKEYEYYNAKDPEQFCDLQVQKDSKQMAKTTMATTTTTTTTTSTTTSTKPTRAPGNVILLFQNIIIDS
jgi:hypothetical protein